MTIFSLALLLAAAAAPPAIRVEDVPGRGYAAYVDSLDATELLPVSQRIRGIAIRKCGRLTPRFGRYTMQNGVDTKREVAVILDYRQAFQCIDPATDPYKPVPADWKASASDDDGVTVFVRRYLDYLETGNPGGMAMMDPAMEITRAEWDNLRKDLVTPRTGQGMMTPHLIGWLNNPEGATYPGAYAYFRVTDSHAGIATTCGGLLIQRVRANEYRVSQYDLRPLPQSLVDERGLRAEEFDKLCGP
jgi:hypothetical protein